MPARARSAGIGTRSATGTSRGRCDTPPRRPSVPGTPPVFAGRSAAPSSATLHRGPFGVNRISTTLTYGSTGQFKWERAIYSLDPLLNQENNRKPEFAFQLSHAIDECFRKIPCVS